MASSGSRNLVQMMAGWCVVLAVCGAIVVRGDDIRAMLGLTFSDADPGSEPRRAATAQIAKQTSKSDRTVVLRAGTNGHYEARAHINGRAVDVMVDTGASLVALTFEDAEAAGIFPRAADFKHTVQTANGVARVAAVTLDQVSIEDITIRNVQGFVSERGKLGTTLLGMSFLSKLSRAEMSRGTLTLQE